MAYVECPECGFTANATLGFVSDSCPRCLARLGRRVWLQSKLGGLRPGTRRFERARLLRDAELEESGLAPDSAPAEE